LIFGANFFGKIAIESLLKKFVSLNSTEERKSYAHLQRKMIPGNDVSALPTFYSNYFFLLNSKFQRKKKKVYLEVSRREQK
jgi:hypothetical protein